MTTIQIADEPHPARAARALTRVDTHSSGVDLHHGIYSMRAISRTSSMDRRSRASSVERHIDRSAEKLAEDEDPGLRQAEDYKEKQVFTGSTLAWLAYQSVGVIYGDIGTSPLYVYSSTFKAPPAYDDLVGVLSIVLWTLAIMVTLKYVIVILHADNDGEGGTFSTYSLLSRYLNITNRDPRESSLIRMQRYLSGDLESAGRQMRKGIEGSRFARGLLKVIGVLAVSMVMSDGILTPAQSVLGAVQGIEVVDSNISKSVIVGVTAAILILLFLIQPFGITKISYFFSPIVIVWLGFNAAFGIFNLIKHDWTVLRAFNPGYAFEYLIRHKTDAWRSLGGILLSFTGVEAMFADLGAFSRRAIQLSWLCYVFPCLLLAYIGQAAYISDHPSAYTNPFFNSVPPGTLYPALVSAILAAIVASQAIITATFQLLAQIMKLSYFPQIKVVHTSTVFHGQLYVPMINWTIMVGTVLVAAIYNNTTSLGNAYGVCVMFVTFFDTCMVSLAAIFVWRISPYYVFLPWLTIALLDGTYLSSALTKVPDGAWFTLTLAGILAAAFILWRFGKENQWAAEAEDRFPTSHFLKNTEDGQVRLTERYGGATISPIRGFGIFFDKAGETTPVVFSQFVSKLVATPEVMVFFHLRPLETPTIAPERRYTVSRLSIPCCYRVVLRHGYLDEVITPDLAAVIYEQVRNSIILRGKTPDTNSGNTYRASETTTINPSPSSQSPQQEQSSASNLPEDPEKEPELEEEGNHDVDPPYTPSSPPQDLALDTELSILEHSYTHQVLYIIGKETLYVKPKTGWFRSILLHTFLWVRENTRTKIAHLKVPKDRVFEVGFIKSV